MQIKQTLLKNGDRHQIVWLPIDKMVHKGTILTLRGDETKTKWEVVEQYDTMLVQEPATLWGLNLPKSQRTEI